MTCDTDHTYAAESLGYTYCPSCGKQLLGLSTSDAPTCLVEVEIQEDRRRYVTIEASQEKVDRICEWLLKHNPTASEHQAAIDAVKAAKVIKEEVIQDTYEIFIVDFPSDNQ